MHPRSIGLAVIGFILLLTPWGCDYGRMKDQEAIQTYKTQIPEMPARTVPLDGGLHALKEMGPDGLLNPLPFSKESVDRGKTAYGNYCIMCHGPGADGRGTVGQSFYPLPTDLKSPYVQKQTDGRLFYTITFGLNRQPALGFIVSEADRWAILHYMRSFVTQQGASSKE